MSDIVERLRDQMQGGNLLLLREAAYEIERLRADLQEIRYMARKVILEANDETSRVCLADGVDKLFARRALEQK